MRIYRYGELVQTRTVTGTSHIERGPDDAGLLWGMYTVKVAAVNANGDAGEEAETDPLTVGLTGKPDTPTAEGGIGNMTLTWRQPAADPDPPRTVFYARVRRVCGHGAHSCTPSASMAGTRVVPFLLSMVEWSQLPACSHTNRSLRMYVDIQCCRHLCVHRARLAGRRFGQWLRGRDVCEDHPAALWRVQSEWKALLHSPQHCCSHHAECGQCWTAGDYGVPVSKQAASFSEQTCLHAGRLRARTVAGCQVTIFGRNVNGDGEASEQTDVTKVGECCWLFVAAVHLASTHAACHAPCWRAEFPALFSKSARHALPAELSNRPAVTAVAGFADKAVLTVLRPDILENYTALSYKVGRVVCWGATVRSEGQLTVCATPTRCSLLPTVASALVVCRLSCTTRPAMPFLGPRRWCPPR